MRLDKTKNAVRNMSFGLLNKITSIVLPFAVRTVFIRVLGEEYLGLSSLFSSVLMVLSMTELGFSSAIVYHMYKPIAEDDTATINALLHYYKTVYRIIGCIILGVGCLLIPILPYLIKGSAPSDINLTIIYLIYLGNTAASYFLFAYYSALISAFQRGDLISKANILVSFAMYVVQILCLLFVKNYYAYIAIMPAFTILNNLRIRTVARRVFPECRPEGNIGPELKADIRQKVGGLMISKVSGVSRNAFDSIFISMFLGLADTAMYNNYYYIMNAVTGVMIMFITSIRAGVGNSVALDSVETNYHNMKKMNFLYMWISGWFTICLLCLYQPFMKLWMGENLMFPMATVVLLCVYFYVLKIGDIRSIYVDTKGAWWENRYRATLEAAANIALNYFLGKYYGVNGIIVATLLSLFFINFLYGSQIIFRYYFGMDKIRDYYRSNIEYAVVTSLAAVITLGFCRSLPVEGLIGLFLKAAICTMIPNVIYWICYRKTNEYQMAAPWILEKFHIEREITK